MAKFLVRRFIAMIGLLIAVSIVTFALFTLAPSDPARDSCGKSCTPERIADIRVALGLDKPLVNQYAEYMKGLVVGRDIGTEGATVHCGPPCFGRSFQDNQMIWDVIKSSMPYTVSLAVGAAIIWLVSGVALGILAGLNRGRFLDRIAVAASSLGVSLPVPLIGLTLIWLVNTSWHWLPYTSGQAPALPWDSGGPVDWLKNFILPWLTLAVLFSASYVRLTRANMIETMSEDFIRTATAKGLTRRKVTLKHGLRAAITPIVTIFGLDLGTVLGGAVLTEFIYSLPGLGRESVQAVNNGDQPKILALVLFAAFFIILANIVVDFVYALIDPRVRL